jgi:holo-[acyl-carrier protein] synthase
MHGLDKDSRDDSPRSRDVKMIVGLGFDIAETDRIAAAIERHGRAFLERVFTENEIRYCERHKSKYERYAARFAAKEAAMKALGTGWRKGVRWRDIEVRNEPSGKPGIHFAGEAGKHAERLGALHFHVSITHSGNIALAQVILED